MVAVSSPATHSTGPSLRTAERLVWVAVARAASPKHSSTVRSAVMAVSLAPTASDPGLAGKQTAVDGGQDGGVVALGLVGVALREQAERTIGLVAPAEVAGDHRRAAGARVPLREKQPADSGVVGQRRGVDAVDDDGSFHVAELAHVVLALTDRGPAEQRVADRLQRLLVLHDALSLVVVPRRVAVHVLRHHGPPRLLELEEQHVVGAGALAERDVGTEPDGAHPDDLVRDVDQSVAAEDLRPLRRQGPQ